MFKTIKTKFIIFSITIILLSISIPVSFLLYQVNRNFHDRSILMIDATLDMLLHGLNISMMTGDNDNIQRLIKDVSSKPSIEHLRIFNESGIINYSNNPSELGKNINNLFPGHLDQDISSITKRSIYLDKETKVYKAIQPIVVEERCQACHKGKKILSYLDVDTGFTKAEINYYTGSFHILFLGAVLIFILAVGFYFLFNRLINQPLNNFILALDAVEKGNMEMRLPTEGEDEFSKLNYHYNRMVHELKYSREKIDELHTEQLQRADKMAVLGELTASMAHDINNYSAIIMSRSDYLLYEAERNSSMINWKGDLEVINNQIDKISQITGNILKHSKKLSKEFKNFDLINLVEQCILLMRPLIKKQNVHISEEYKLDKANIFGDPNQIEQVVLNLLSNSLDALTDNGDIKITIQQTNNNKIQLVISDNGTGINEDAMDKIFSPFYTNKKNDNGTGLGLYIVSKICKNHKAEIECKSKLNFGTTFTITFDSEIKND